MPDTVTIVSRPPAGSVADIDAFLAGIETPALRLQAEVDRLAQLPVRLAPVDRMHSALAALRTAAAGPAGAVWRDLQLLHEAVDLARFDSMSLDVQDLLLLETRATNGMEGTLPLGQRYLHALRGLAGTSPAPGEPPDRDGLVTAWLRIARDPSRWPKDREADPGCIAVAEARAEADAALEAHGPALARLLLAYKRMQSVELPDVDGTPGSDGDAPEFRERLAASLEPGDTAGALAAMHLGQALARVGLLERPAWFLAQALRLTPPPSTDGDTAELAWLATAIADAAERAAARARDVRLQLEVLGHRVRAIGGRDRRRSDMLAVLFRNPVVTAGRLADLAGVSSRAALAFCDLMVEHRIARNIGHGAGHRMVKVDQLV